MDASRARHILNNQESVTQEVTFANFTRDLDFKVRRASLRGNSGTVVTAEIPCWEKAEAYILEKGYTIVDKGKSSSELDYWFRIKW